MGAQISKVLGISCGTNAQILLACHFDNQGILRVSSDHLVVVDRLPSVISLCDSLLNAIHAIAASA